MDFYTRRICVNNKNLIIKSYYDFSTKNVTSAILGSHGRYPIHRYFTQSDIIVPNGTKFLRYLPHNSNIMAGHALDLLEKIKTGSCLEHTKREYSSLRIVKNYFMRRWDHWDDCMPTKEYDIIQLLDDIDTKDIVDALNQRLITYSEIHFISCRNVTLTKTGRI